MVDIINALLDLFDIEAEHHINSLLQADRLNFSDSINLLAGLAQHHRHQPSSFALSHHLINLLLEKARVRRVILNGQINQVIDKGAFGLNDEVGTLIGGNHKPSAFEVDNS